MGDIRSIPNKRSLFDATIDNRIGNPRPEEGLSKIPENKRSGMGASNDIFSQKGNMPREFTFIRALI